MDRDDDNFFEKTDWNTYNEERKLDECAYCSEEDDNLNIVHWERRVDHPYDVRIVAVNPLPHEHINIRGGYVKETELVCNECLKEILNNE